MLIDPTGQGAISKLLSMLKKLFTFKPKIDPRTGLEFVAVEGPGILYYTTKTREYVWYQTQSNSSYTISVVTNGWANSAASGYWLKR